jgi:hypothetical protein
MNLYSIEREFQWRGERCRATIVPTTRHGMSPGRPAAQEQPRWALERANHETYLGPEYLPGEENPPGWSAALARFHTVLDREAP